MVLNVLVQPHDVDLGSTNVNLLAINFGIVSPKSPTKSPGALTTSSTVLAIRRHGVNILPAPTPHLALL